MPNQCAILHEVNGFSPILMMCLRFLVLFLLPAISLSAQDYFDEEPEHPRRNSISLYTTAAASALMGGFPNSPRLGVVYRRQSSAVPQRTWRMQGVVDFFDVNDESDNLLTDIIRVTDTSMVYRWKNDEERRFAGRFGIEWSDPEERYTPVYGIDLILGVNYLLDQRGQVSYLRDTLVNEVRPLAADPGQFLFTRDQVHLQYLAGAAFTIGYRLRAGENWDFLFQMSPEFYFSVYDDVRGQSLPARTDDTPPTSFWMQLRLIEMQLGYRF